MTKSQSKGSGQAIKDTGAGPGVAAHSKDSKTAGKSGQATKASSKK